MKRRMFATTAAVLISMTTLVVLLCILGRTGPGVSNPALAAPMQITPTVALIDPSSAPNDLDTLLTVTGTDFVSVPAVYLGNTSLSDVEWVTGTVLRATVPWGMDPGTYTLTVNNPGGESDDLPNAFTVTLGIGAWNAGKLYGGEVNQIAINPITPTTVYAVSKDVGIFRSRDGGETWSFVYASTNARDLAVDPITPTTIYWGTYGLYRSDDEGDTWSWLPAPGDFVPYPHPTISGTLYAAHGEGLWKSTDRGQTWVTKTNGLTDTVVTGLVFHPTDPMTMYLGTANGNVFRSANGGDSWGYVAHPINYIMTLAINPRGTHELWVSNHCLDRPELTLRSTDLEHTAWITVGEPVGTSSLMSVDFPPRAWGDTFSQTVLAQGCWCTPNRSEDNGDTWQELPLSESYVQNMALHPTISNTLYGGTQFEGVVKSEDGGQTYWWINQGIMAMYPQQMATVPGQPDVVYAITDRKGGIYKGTRGGANWEFLEFVESSLGTHFDVVAVDPFTSTRVYAAAGAPGHLGTGWWIHISEDGGQTWPTYTFVSAPEPYSDCNAVLPQVIRANPAQPGALLAGVTFHRHGTPIFEAGGIYSSTDYGGNWTYIDVGQVISPVTDIAYDREITTVVYAATGWQATGTGMLRSIDSGQTWQPMGKAISALDYVESFAVELSDPYRVFAWIEWPYHDLYVSENHGVTWTLASSPPGFDVQLLCTDEKPSMLYAATSEGLYRSTDGGQSWQRAAGMLGYVPIYSLATVTATERVILYAGTTGGYVQSGEVQALRVANNSGTLVSAGVYRYTTRRPRELYLPLVLRAYTP
jgi:photosystem II stability/assembly factor-like uncharacterized protein